MPIYSVTTLVFFIHYKHKMKFKLIIPFLLSTLLSFFNVTSTQSIQTTIVAATTTTTPLDSDGQEVQSGLKYYIAPVQSNNTGGGLSLDTRDNFCPPFVVQENSQLSKGLSLRFIPLDNKQNNIYLSSDLNILFNAATICVQSTVWKLSSIGGGGGDMVAGRRYYVRSGGVIGRPGVGTVNNWFRIEKAGDIGYKFVFCPSVCSSCKVVCGDVGVYEEKGERWLALVDQPLVFTLKKA
ncbi:miraculin-like [Bidens hawaiensis]|uniref:miraculin-like n=1 Tax=Bidens hawaiensis TaxID=980011 RepID=UPI00404B5C07